GRGGRLSLRLADRSSAAQRPLALTGTASVAGRPRRLGPLAPKKVEDAAADQPAEEGECGAEERLPTPSILRPANAHRDREGHDEGGECVERRGPPSPPEPEPQA